MDKSGPYFGIADTFLLRFVHYLQWELVPGDVLTLEPNV